VAARRREVLNPESWLLSLATMDERSLIDAMATATLGVDTLWGGNVLSASGTGRFIADCWFSDEPLPAAYTHETAAPVRQSGGVSGRTPDTRAIEAYLDAVDLAGAIEQIRRGALECGDARRRAYLEGLAACFGVMWDLALERLGRGPAVPFDRCVRAATGQDPQPSDPRARIEHLRRLLEARGEAAQSAADMADAVHRWRQERLVAPASIKSLAAIRIAEMDRLTALHLMPQLPRALAPVPRANIEFLPIANAWFSGSMNYLGRARTTEGRPRYEATYEINASLEISIPEFEHLIAHEVVPGHVTTFAFLQDLYVRGQVGFEASALTINTRAATLFEGIANNAILVAHGVTDVAALDDPDTQVGVLLAQLQDEAKNQAAWLTWHEGVPEEVVAVTLRREFLVSAERASKLAGAWGRHPLLGRMCLPAYRAGTEVVARLLRQHAPSVVLPAIYGCRGLVDIVTVQELLESEGRETDVSR
jgi:hypothetical protein